MGGALFFEYKIIVCFYFIYPPPRFARRREWVFLPTCPVSLPLPLCLCLPVPKPLPLPKPKHLPSSSGVWSVLKNLDLGGRAIPAPGRRARGLTPKKPSKTNEKSMIRALEPPGTSPERSGTAQDHLKARNSHPRAAQDRPVRPPRRPVRPPRRHVVCPGSSSVCPGSNSVCPGSNSVCPGNTKIIEALLQK
mgnify:CR=1 FL=1